MPKKSKEFKVEEITNLESSLEYLMKKYKLDKSGLKNVIDNNSAKLFKNLGDL